MNIKRIGTTQRWSDVVIHNQTLYLVEVPLNTLELDISAQTQEVLRNIENTLIAHGSAKNQLLMVTIYLSSMKHLDLFNQLWDAWLPAGSAPVRACVKAKLAHKQYLVELQVIAAII